MKIVYPAKFKRGADGRVLVTFRDLPEAGTDGATMAEARAEAADLLNSVLMFRMKYREDIPAPTKARKGERPVRPDPAVAMKVALYIAMRQRGMKAADLTRGMGIDNRETQRILNPYHATKTARMGEAIEVTGSHAVIELQTG